MITALISFQIVKFIIGLLVLVLFTFLIFAGILLFKSNDLDKMFTKSQKEQLDYLVNTYHLIYIIDNKLDDKERDKIKHEIFQIQNYIMEMAKIVAGAAGEVYVTCKMEKMCRK